ncbi:MAG: dephospho-CoA kinase [Sedimentitalea sp.]|uniref:dephospho-CoA kinase n=1 Tax=Sedimentitalea sp. TaxID=2048915 RepID=UPI003264D3DD
MRFLLGLTGSIGMGKSTTAAMFVDEGCEVWDADAAVHRIYAVNGPAVAPLGEIYPQSIRDGAVDRMALKAIIAEDSDALKQIEAVVHPLVAKDRNTFKESATADVLVFDIPLLFETGGDAAMDAVACVSVAPDIQEQRVLARGTMTREQFEMIRAKQMPDTEKRARSDYVIITDTLDHARAQVHNIVKEIREQQSNA